MSTSPTVGYWSWRGRAQAIRLLLKYAGIQFTDKRYANPKDWQSEKFTLGLDFPNIPYYIDGDLKLTQSMAIMRYLGEKHGLSATADPQRAVQDMAEQQLQDVLQGFLGIMFGPGDGEAKPPAYITGTLEPQLDLLAKFLADKQWLTGDQLSYVDFHAYELLDKLRLYAPESVAKHPNIGQYLDRFEALPAIKAYMSSDEFKSWPVFGARAKWGGK
ncbi:unnamed protein product [Medioppia subpectinata]|uniref:glutathione transferase n=1 Tax=Medioppia subpectinata TaxID=1979941 RepID=A0A7R9Q1M2_9ACAR|nr:unnamed protein product [Medioppia subpectinata]CAG2108476.1 unnamed protein product [Medioppia subpectinata]